MSSRAERSEVEGSNVWFPNFRHDGIRSGRHSEKGVARAAGKLYNLSNRQNEKIIS